MGSPSLAITRFIVRSSDETIALDNAIIHHQFETRVIPGWVQMTFLLFSLQQCSLVVVKWPNSPINRTGWVCVIKRPSYPLTLIKQICRKWALLILRKGIVFFNPRPKALFTYPLYSQEVSSNVFIEYNCQLQISDSVLGRVVNESVGRAERIKILFNLSSLPVEDALS